LEKNDKIGPPSDTKAARWKRSQRERKLLKPPAHVVEFAARLRQQPSK
jgi:hypothetical protein